MPTAFYPGIIYEPVVPVDTSPRAGTTDPAVIVAQLQAEMVAVQTALGPNLSNLQPVVAPAASGDVTGATDTAALAAISVDGTTILLRPYQVYYVTVLPHSTPRRRLIGDPSTTVMFVGSGACWTISNPNFSGNGQKFTASGAGAGTLTIPANSQVTLGMGVSGTGLTPGTGGWYVSSYVPSTGVVGITAWGTASGAPINGDLYSFSPPAVYLDNMGGQMGGFVIDGLGRASGAASCGIEMGDIYGLDLSNTFVRNFTGTANYLSTPQSSTLGSGSTGVAVGSLGGSIHLSGTNTTGWPASGTVVVPTTTGTALFAYTSIGGGFLLSGVTLISGTGSTVAGSVTINLQKGDAAFWVNNVNAWMEECTIRGTSDNCTNAVLFDTQSSGTPSKEYNRYDFSVRAYPNQNGVVLQAGSYLNGELYIRGNFEKGVTNTGTMLIIGADGSTCALGQTSSPSGEVDLEVRCECNAPAGTVSHTDFYLGWQSTVFASGTISLGGAAAGNITLPNPSFIFAGILRADSGSLGKFNNGLVCIGAMFASSGIMTGNGTDTPGPTIWGGVGVPNIPGSVQGDVYHRSDPGAGLTNIYKASGANTWGGIV